MSYGTYRYRNDGDCQEVWVPVEPTIVERPEQLHVALRGFVTRRTFPEMADRLPGILGRLAGRGIEPVGAPCYACRGG